MKPLSLDKINNSNRPTFSTWSMENLVKIAGDLHDQNIQLRYENEQLRLEIKSLNELNNKDDWK